MKAFTKKSGEAVIALAGNPNVGKSTVFNALTGMHQHTGNWPGKTVAVADGGFTYNNMSYRIIDLPGTYSLMARSEEEAVASEFLRKEKYDAVVIVTDATCLERNLNLALQIREITDKVVLCVNLCDEAKRKNITIDAKKLSKSMGNIPVVLTSAVSKRGFDKLLSAIEDTVMERVVPSEFKTDYGTEIELALQSMENVTRAEAIYRLCNSGEGTKEAFAILEREEITRDNISDIIAMKSVIKCEEIASEAVVKKDKNCNRRDRRIDKILTGRLTGIPIMLMFFALIFYITAVGANYPSGWLYEKLFAFEPVLYGVLSFLPQGLRLALTEGVYRTVAWIVSVMLPPMAIFFPLFTLLEDLGYLPRIAFNLDSAFCRCGTCGKQALTMCMGFGCNAVGVTGCRIIDSPKERIIAMVTNAFVPCNGRFPLLFTMASAMVLLKGGEKNSLVSALIVTAMVVLSVPATLLVSKLLSKTLIKHRNASFILELPPYRMPRVLKVIVRSVLDRTVFVLLRALKVAAPAGLIIWLMGNISVGDTSLLAYVAGFLDPVGRLMGLDGSILTGFVLGIPANEIVLPVIMMCYTSGKSLVETGGVETLGQYFAALGWTPVTAFNIMLFSLMHFPCTTTLLTIKKESGSLKVALLGFILPAVCGFVVCVAVNLIYNLLF